MDYNEPGAFFFTPRSFSRGSVKAFLERPQRAQVQQPRTRLFLPDSSSVSASNVPSAPEPNDVSRHAFCPSSSLRPNAPFQLLRAGRWRRAPGGFAHRPGLFSSSHPRNRFRSLRRDPGGSSQCPHSSEPAGVGTLLVLLPSAPLPVLHPPPSLEHLTCWNMNSCENYVALCWRISDIELRVAFDGGRGQPFDPAHFVKVSVLAGIKPSHHGASRDHVTCPPCVRSNVCIVKHS